MNKEELYHLMFECLDYGEYDLALKFAEELDKKIGMKYYTMVVENTIKEKENFVRSLKKIKKNKE